MADLDNQSLKLEAEDILNFLRVNPDFFQHHQNILSELDLPHESGTAVSLIERQISILRNRNLEMRKHVNRLINAAKVNEALFDKTRTLILVLLQAEGWQDLNEILATYVLADFQADFVCLHIENDTIQFEHVIGHQGKLPKLFSSFGSNPLIQTFRGEELSELFPPTKHTESGSAVIAPIKLNSDVAFLSIGSKDPQYFSNNMDTLFIGYIADIFSGIAGQIVK